MLPVTIPLITADSLQLYSDIYSDETEAASLWPSFADEQPLLCNYLLSRREMFSDELSFRKFSNGVMFLWTLIQIEKRLEPPFWEVDDDTQN